MDAGSIIAWAAVAIAGLYLIAAAITWPRRRRQRLAEAAAEPDHTAVLNLVDRPPLQDEPTPDRMRKLAGIFAAIAARVWSEPFDFTVESMAAVDRAIVTGWGDDAPDAD